MGANEVYTHLHTYACFPSLSGMRRLHTWQALPLDKNKTITLHFFVCSSNRDTFQILFLTPIIILCMSCTKLHNLHSPIQHFNIFPKTRSTHSLMCLATKMWSMKMCSFVPFFLKRPRRAACEKVKWIICSYLYTV